MYFKSLKQIPLLLNSMFTSDKSRLLTQPPETQNEVKKVQVQLDYLLSNNPIIRGSLLTSTNTSGISQSKAQTGVT